MDHFSASRSQGVFCDRFWKALSTIASSLCQNKHHVLVLVIAFLYIILPVTTY